MRSKSILGTGAVCVGLAGAVIFATGCSFDPLKFVSRNACEIVDCDVLFFVDDILPLSGGPIMDGDAAPDEDTESGGH